MNKSLYRVSFANREPIEWGTTAILISAMSRDEAIYEASKKTGLNIVLSTQLLVRTNA